MLLQTIIIKTQYTMCGILALLNSARSADELRVLALKRRVFIRHRGPDGSGIYPMHFHKADKQHILVHERLSMVGVESGKQPLHNPSKTLSLVANGEIYNAEELKDEIDRDSGTPYPYEMDSDCEIFLAAYEHHQNELKVMLNRFNGIFSFVVIDEERERFIIARDNVGATSLYYGKLSDGTIMVASELKALDGVCESYEEFPAGFVYCSSWEKPLQRWYEPKWREIIPRNSPDLEKIRSIVESAVSTRLQFDITCSLMLSGGLESSLMAAVAVRLAEKENAKSKLHSFSIGLEGASDLQMAAKVAKYLDLEHKEVTFTAQQGFDAVREVIYSLETYDVETIRAGIPMYLLARYIKAMGIKVVLSGDGADEIFGGNSCVHNDNAPSAEEMHYETVKRIENLQYRDCLRNNKGTMAWGVECRAPFLDGQLVEYVMNLDPEYKMVKKRCTDECDSRQNIEKCLLRRAFDTADSYLPSEVLWRRKESFSNGVGRNWTKLLQEGASKRISDIEMKNAHEKYPENTPATKEELYYRMLFDECFSNKNAAKTVKSKSSD